MFSCVWLHFKKCFEKYFLMFGCVLENIIENTFSTCCSHFLTFSRLPNEYIISFIPQNTNKTQKKIIKSGQTKARSRSERSALPRQPVMLADGTVPVMSRSFLSLSLSLSLSSIFQGRKLFEVKIETENHFCCFGSQIRLTGNAFQFDRI